MSRAPPGLDPSSSQSERLSRRWTPSGASCPVGAGKYVTRGDLRLRICQSAGADGAASCWAVAIRLIYQLACQLFRWLALLARSSASKDVEILMLRHQFGVAQRIQPRPQFSWSDRAVMAALLRMVNKQQRARLVLLFTPRSVLRWHTRLVARKWTYPRRNPGRPSKPGALRHLVLRLARENPGGGTAGSTANCSTWDARSAHQPSGRS